MMTMTFSPARARTRAQALGLTTRDLSRRADIPFARLRALLTGQVADPEAVDLARLSLALQVNPEYLLGLTNVFTPFPDMEWGRGTRRAGPVWPRVADMTALVDLSCQDLADRVGVPVGQQVRWERGATEGISSLALARLAVRAHIPVAYLLGLSGDTGTPPWAPGDWATEEADFMALAAVHEAGHIAGLLAMAPGPAYIVVPPRPGYLGRTYAGALYTPGVIPEDVSLDMTAIVAILGPQVACKLLAERWGFEHMPPDTGAEADMSNLDMFGVGRDERERGLALAHDILAEHVKDVERIATAVRVIMDAYARGRRSPLYVDAHRDARGRLRVVVRQGWPPHKTLNALLRGWDVYVRWMREQGLVPEDQASEGGGVP